jgi:hypothetical protein
MLSYPLSPHWIAIILIAMGSKQEAIRVGLNFNRMMSASH